MEHLLQDFGRLLGIQHLHSMPGKLLRLNMENLGDLDLFYDEGRLLVRFTKTVPFLGKNLFLNLLSFTRYRCSYSQPIRPWFQTPDRIGLGIIFLEHEVTPDRLYQQLEFFTKELETVCS